MLTVMEPRVGLVLLKSLSSMLIAGERMEVAKGVSRVMAESSHTRAHFCRAEKLKGTAGSSSLSQPTMPVAILVKGSAS